MYVLEQRKQIAYITATTDVWSWRNDMVGLLLENGVSIGHLIQAETKLGVVSVLLAREGGGMARR